MQHNILLRGLLTILRSKNRERTFFFVPAAKFLEGPLKLFPL